MFALVKFQIDSILFLVTLSNGVFRICFIFYFLRVRLLERGLLKVPDEIRERLRRPASEVINY